MGLTLFDVQQSLRGLQRNSRYVLTLALVSALTLASIAVLLVQVYSVRFIQLPEERNGKVVVVRSEVNTGGMLEVYELDSYAQNQEYFQALTPYINRQVTLIQDAQVLSISAAAVRSDFFQVFPASPLYGRIFSPEDSYQGAPPVALISHRLWMTEFRGRPDIIGEVFIMDTQPIEIVGVMPEGFRYPQTQDLWINLEASQARAGAGAFALGVGLLKGDELTASYSLTNIRRQIERQHPQIYGEDQILVERLVTWSSSILDDQILFMTITIIAVMLIGSLCMLNLMASQFFARVEEWRLRAVLGGNPRTLLVTLQVEALIIFSLGFMLAYLLFQGTIYSAADYLIIHNHSVRPFWWQANLSAPVVALLVGLIITLTIFSILWFFFYGARLFHQSESQVASMKYRNLRVTRWGYAFLQVCLTTFLLSFFLLSTTSYYSQVTRDLGFDKENILVADVMPNSLRPQEFKTEELLPFLESVPGVKRVSFSDYMPGGSTFRARQYTNLHPTANQYGQRFLNQIAVTPSFFDVMSIELVAGRRFDLADYEGGTTPSLSLMDTKTSKLLSAGETMLGERVSLRAASPIPGMQDDVITIVGLVSDVDYESDFMNNVIYTPLPPFLHQNGLLMQVKTFGNPLNYVNELESALQTYNVNFTLSEPKTVKQLMAERGRGSATLILNFLPAVILAVVMCVVGIFDVAKSLANNSRREIGICKAIGMSDHQVLLKHMLYGLICVGAGLVAGAVTFLAARPLIVDRLVEDVTHYIVALLISVGLTALICLVAISVPLIKMVKERSIAELIRSDQ